MTALASSACVKSEPEAATRLDSAGSAASGPFIILPGIKAASLKEKIVASKKPAVVNLWATWCEPCKVEMPVFKKFRDSKAGERVNVFFISADNSDDVGKALEFAEEMEIKGPFTYRLAENADEFGKAIAPTWSATLPTTFIFDAQGKLKTFWVGESTLKQLEAKVEKALAEPKQDPALQRHAK